MIPSIGLVLLIACIALLTYLASVGIPRFVLDEIEQEADKQGLELSIGSARLGYVSGLSFLMRDIDLRLSQHADGPQIKLGRTRVGLRLSSLLKGQIEPYMLQISRGELSVPSSEEGENLSITDLKLTSTLDSKQVIRLITPSPMNINGLELKFKGEFLVKLETHVSAVPDAEESPITLGEQALKLLESYQADIDFISQLVHQQLWTTEGKPQISISYNAINAPRCSFDLFFPSIVYEDSRFSDVYLNGAFSNDTVVIHQLLLHSFDGDQNLVSRKALAQRAAGTKALLQGGYNLKSRQLSFTLDSNMPLLSIASGLIKPEDFELIERISLSSKDKSELSLKGDIMLTPDFTMGDATILGYILQKNIQIDDCKVKELVFSFFYKDGNFAVDQAEIKMGDEGVLSLASHLRQGKGGVDINAKLSMEQLHALLSCSLIKLDFDIPQGLQMAGPFVFTAQAGMDSADFAAGRLPMVDFLPEIDALNFSLELPQISFDGQVLSSSKLTGSIDRFYGWERDAKLLAEKVELKFQMDEIQLKLRPEPFVDAWGGYATFIEEGLVPQRSISTVVAHIPHQLRDLKLPSIYRQLHRGIASMLCQANIKLNQAVGQLQMDLQIPQISLVETDEGSSIQCSSLQASAAIRDISGEDYEVGRASVIVQGFQNVNFSDLVTTDASDAILLADASKITFRGESIEALAVHTKFSRLTEFETKINLLINEAKGEMVTMQVQKDKEDSLDIKDIRVAISPDLLKTIIPLDELKERGIKLGADDLTLTGDMEFALDGFAPEFKRASFDLVAPRLLRRGVNVHQNRKLEEQFSFSMQLDLSVGSQGEYLFNIPEFSIAQGNHHLSGSARCDQPDIIKIDAQSNFLLSTLDLLIDDHLTHLIMRDFTMNAQSEVNVNNLKLVLDMNKGLDIKATAEMEIKNIDGLLGTYTRETDPLGQLNKTDLRSKEEYTKLQSRLIHGTAQVDVDVIMGERDAQSGKRSLKKSQIDINKVKLTYDNRPWLRYKKISGGVNQSSFTVDKVRIDTFKNFVAIYKGQGCIYPDYSIGMFFARLRQNLDVLELVKPVDLLTDYCVFPISLTSKVEMDGNIFAKSKSAFKLKLVGERFPLKNFSGFIDFRKGGIYLDRINASLGQGVVDAQVLLTLGEKGMGYDGQLYLNAANLRELAAIFDIKQGNALIAGECRFRAKSLELDDLQAYGKLSIRDGDLLQLRIFSPISDLINNLPKLIDSRDKSLKGEIDEDGSRSFYESIADTTREYTAAGLEHATSGISQVGNFVDSVASNVPGVNYFFKYDLQEADASFSIADGVFISPDLVAKGCNLSVSSTLHIALKQMYIEADLWPDVSSIVTIMLSPVTAISDGIIDIKLHGTFDDLKWVVRLNDWSGNPIEGHSSFKARTAHIKKKPSPDDKPEPQAKKD